MHRVCTRVVFFSSRRRHTRFDCDWSSDVCSSDLLQQLDDSLIARYTSQPTRLPAELRRQIEHAWHGAPVQLYALADLDQGLRLSEAWLALGPRYIAVAKRESDGWDVRSFERSRIEAVREAPGLSANTDR